MGHINVSMLKIVLLDSALLHFFLDFDECSLSERFMATELVEGAEVLHSFHFNSVSAFNRNVYVLPRGANSSSSDSTHSEDSTYLSCKLNKVFSRLNITMISYDFGKGDAQPVQIEVNRSAGRFYPVYSAGCVFLDVKIGNSYLLAVHRHPTVPADYERSLETRGY